MLRVRQVKVKVEEKDNLKYELSLKLKTNVNNMRELQSISFAVASQCTNTELKKELENLTKFK
jgi:membrane carboxypeptidase/penicillin-binding protein PbpC